MINLLQVLNNLLFPKKHICLMCREQNSNVRNYICKDCFDNLDIVDKEIGSDSSNLKKIHLKITFIFNYILLVKSQEENLCCHPNLRARLRAIL